MTKKHIVFIPCGVLPIPAVRGGAVENLVWQLADLNDRYGDTRANMQWFIFTDTLNGFLHFIE